MDVWGVPWTAEGGTFNSGVMWQQLTVVMTRRARKKKIHQYIFELTPIFYRLQTKNLEDTRSFIFLKNHVVIWELISYQKIVPLTH